MTIALAKDSKAEKQVAVPIGVAKLKVNGDFVSHGEMITMDLPVYTIEQSQKLNQLNSTDGRPPQAVQVIKIEDEGFQKEWYKGNLSTKRRAA